MTRRDDGQVRLTHSTTPRGPSHLTFPLRFETGCCLPVIPQGGCEFEHRGEDAVLESGGDIAVRTSAPGYTRPRQRRLHSETRRSPHSRPRRRFAIWKLEVISYQQGLTFNDTAARANRPLQGHRRRRRTLPIWRAAL